MSFSDIFIIHWVFNPVIYMCASFFVLGRAKLLSFHHVFLISYIILIYTGSINVYSDNLGDIRFLYLVWSIPYIYLLSLYFAIAITSHSRIDIENAFYDASIDGIDDWLKPYLNFASIFFITLPIIYIIDKGISNVALFYLILNPGNALESMVLRIESLSSNISPILTGIYSYSRSLFYPLYCAFITSMIIRRKISILHYSSVMIASVVFSFASAAKAPLAIIFISVFLAWYFEKQGRISRLYGTILLGLSFVIPSIVYPLMVGATGQEAVSVILESLWSRLTLVPAYASGLYFEAFGSLYDYVGLSSNRIFSSVFRLEYKPVAAIIYDQYIKTSISGGLVNAGYFASFYADWGYWGATVGTSMIAFLLQYLQRYFDAMNSSAARNSSRVIVIIATSQLMLADFYSTAYGRGLLSVPFLFLFLRLLYSTRRNKTRAYLVEKGRG